MIFLQSQYRLAFLSLFTYTIIYAINPYPYRELARSAVLSGSETFYVKKRKTSQSSAPYSLTHIHPASPGDLPNSPTSAFQTLSPSVPDPSTSLIPPGLLSIIQNIDKTLLYLPSNPMIPSNFLLYYKLPPPKYNTHPPPHSQSNQAFHCINAPRLLNTALLPRQASPFPRTFHN